MISSILLLIVFQGFWLVNTYERAYFNLRREVNMLFRNTLINLQYSSMMKNMVEIEGDSVNTTLKVIQIDSVVAEKSAKVKQSLKNNLQVYIRSDKKHRITTQDTKIFSGGDSLRNKEKSAFFVRISNDTLPFDTLNINYANALKASHIDAQFILETNRISNEVDLPGLNSTIDFIINNRKDMSGIHEVKVLKEDNIFRDTIFTEQIKMPHLQNYGAKVFPVRSLVLKQIAPQILFSFLLLFIVTAAFVVMFRNLRAQQKLMELKNDLISNITHELKTPVATVSVALEALKNFNAMSNPQRTAEYLDIAQSELNRLTLMTDKILKTSVFESKGLEINFEPVDLGKIVSKTVSSLKLVFERRNINLQFLQEGSYFTVEGAETHLTNVVYNLLENALKYSHDHTSVTVKLQEEDRNIILSVKDEGIGIATEYQDKIFEKFFRVPSGDVHNTKGYGLGLAYVAGVIKSHDGKIEVMSAPEKGSTFRISLPKQHAG